MLASLRAWYTPAEIESLADRRAVISGAFDISDLARFCDSLQATGGEVRFELQFMGGATGWQRLALRLRCECAVPCQRCLESMALTIEESTDFAIVLEPGAEAGLPAELEHILLDEGRFDPKQLIEDELIIAAPYAPKHNETTACGPVAEGVGN